MDISRLHSGENAMKHSTTPFIDLTSDGVEENDDGVVQVIEQHHINGSPPRAYDGEADQLSADNQGDEENEDAGDVWAVSSLIEDAVEAMGDQEAGDDDGKLSI